MESYILPRLLVRLANAMWGTHPQHITRSEDVTLKPRSKSSFKQNRRKQLTASRAKKLKKLNRG